MSALPPKADMFSVKIDVCFVPITDIRDALPSRHSMVDSSHAGHGIA